MTQKWEVVISQHCELIILSLQTLHCQSLTLSLVHSLRLSEAKAETCSKRMSVFLSLLCQSAHISGTRIRSLNTNTLSLKETTLLKQRKELTAKISISLLF